jgi:lysophospholipase L1-like esterase
MKNTPRISLQVPALGALLLTTVLAAHGNTAVEPKPYTWPPAQERHASFLEISKKGGVDVLFLGDSITENWRSSGKAVWDANFAPMHAANFGIGGDRTQNVLWRIANGELDGIKPKVVVLLIGNNNVGLERNRLVLRNTTAEAIEGVAAVVKAVRAKLPGSKILLLAIFPYGEKSNPVREQIKEVNAATARLDDGHFVHFLDIGSKFLEPDGSISRTVMSDLEHPTTKGYEIWAAAIKEPLAELLK